MKNPFCLISGTFVLSVCLLHSVIGQTHASVLENRIDIEFKDASLIYVLGKLSVDYRVPVGLQKSGCEDARSRITISADQMSVIDVLKLIDNQQPDYELKLQDGVVNFVPKKNCTSVVTTLLDLPVLQYIPKLGANKFELRNAIYDLCEVQEFVKEKDLTVNRSEYVNYRSIYAEDNLDLAAQSTTVRGILNKIIRESEHKIWVVELSQDNKQELVIGL